jgi:hypothetical protein
VSRSPRELLAGAILIALLFAAAAGLLLTRERRYPTPVRSEDRSMYLTSGAAVRRLAIGYSALAADLYWIRAIQYYGGTKLTLANETAASRGTPDSGSAYSLLYPMLDITTTLDPHFNIAYRFGAIFLAEPYPRGAGRPELAIALLEKGLGTRPDKWEYMQDIGFVHYWWRHDYRAAAEWFDRASHVQGAPWWLRSLAAVTLAEGGDRRSSRVMWESIRESSEIDWLRREAERRLLQLRALDQIDELQKRIDQSAAAIGRPPADGRTILLGGPVDPTGVPFEIDPDGRVRLSRSSPLFPLPDEPKRPAAPVS